MAATQKHRLITVDTPLGPDVLLFYRLRGKERLGRPFKYRIDLLSEDNAIDPDTLVGQNLCVKVRLANGQDRYFNGYVSRFSQHGTVGEYHLYRAVLKPWLSLLSLTTDCRIFQHMTVPDIVKQVCKDQGFTDIEDYLTENYRTWDYCTQYRESSYRFIRRLLEHEGIYFYFTHQRHKHTLVLADSVMAHRPVDGYQEIPYFPSSENTERRQRDHIDTVSLIQQAQPGRYTLNDYDFEKPKARLLVKSLVTRDHAYADFERYDYPGKYTTTDDGNRYADTRLQAHHSAFEQIEGKGNARGLTTGALFKLTNHPRQDQNREYLIVSTKYRLQSDTYFSGGHDPSTDDCRCHYVAIDSKQTFRPPRLSPKPTIEGPQTAVVVGPAGEEIYTDPYGRVKVQFHWDREGQMDENSSCWLRVSQVHAGKRFGGIDIPRIGEEVIVEFLEGDPDRPIITGRVYNDACMPPHELPANKTVSGIKTHSSKGGRGFNGLEFEDKKGEERIAVHAEKDLHFRVKHQQVTTIEDKSHQTVMSDQLGQVKGDKHRTVKGDYNEKVHGTISRDVEGDLQQRIGGKQGLEAGTEIHLTAGVNVVLEAGASLTLKTGGAFIVLGPSGINFSHSPVIGGSPGSGSGCSPTAPKLPMEAATGKPGEVTSVSPKAQRALQQSAQPAHQPPPRPKPVPPKTPPQGPASNDPVFNPQKGLQLARYLGPIPAIIAGLLVPDNRSLEREWYAQGDHYRYNTDDFSLEITHPDGKKEQLFMYPDGTVTDTKESILGSSDEKGVFRPVTQQEEVRYRAWRANGGQESFAVWKNSGKPLEADGVSGAGARNKALELEAKDGGHSIARHGPDVSDEDLKRRLENGIAPDGKFSPTPASTRFKSHEEWLKTRNDAVKAIEAEESIDLSKPPKPGEKTKHDINIDHGRAIDDGFVGDKSTKIKIKDPVSGKKGTAYPDSIPVSGITRTQTNVEWNPKSNSWEVKQHYPDARNWDQSTQSYRE